MFDCISRLKEGEWTDVDNISPANTKKFIEIFVYMGAVKIKCRRSSLPLEYTPQEDLHNFVANLQTKMKEKSSGVSSTTSTEAGIQLEAFDKHMPSQSKPATDKRV